MAPVHNLVSQVSNAFLLHQSRTAVPDNKTFRSIVHILYKEGFLNSYQLGNEKGPYNQPTKTTPLNVARNRLWLNLKYRDGEPALRKFKCVSLPSRAVYASYEELKAVAAARNGSKLFKAQVLGQITILQTVNHGIIELHEAIEKKIGGKVLAFAF
ncbi:hypothetical protein HDU92_002426 [Lobulomyces angularis]|nr:hypothetical protein HDU92_002426 [Lobulomyces angularis]